MPELFDRRVYENLITSFRRDRQNQLADQGLLPEARKRQIEEELSIQATSIEQDAKIIQLRSSIIEKIKTKFPDTARECRAIMRKIPVWESDLGLLDWLDQEVNRVFKEKDLISAQKGLLHVFQCFEKVLLSKNPEQPSDHGSTPSP